MTPVCPEGQIRRKAYTRKGVHYKASCIRKVSPYDERYSIFQDKERKRMSRRLVGVGKAVRGNTKKCPPGETIRKAYVRLSKTGTRKLVKAACIVKRGKPERNSTRAIGPLRKGELSKYGYVKISNLSEKARHSALAKAVEEFGSLSVWKKVNVLYIYTKNTNPELSAKYDDDRNWIKNKFGLKAF